MKNQFWQIPQFGEKARWLEGPIPKAEKGRLVVEVLYSSINYKDALGFTSRGKIFKKFPIIPGIDLCGEIKEGESDQFKVGDLVLVTGCGLGESDDGGYAKYALVAEEHLVKLPNKLDAKQAMSLGTAGFTAALAIARMEALGQSPSWGEILVTGASGGVGSLACLLLVKKGYEVIAQSEKTTEYDYIRSLGVKEVSSLEGLQLGSRALEKACFAGCIDNIGGETLGKVTKHIGLYGNIASIGLASGSEYQSSVMPHILRGVSILGISSANCPMPLRKEVWSFLENVLEKEDFEKIRIEQIELSDIDKKMSDYFDRKIVGRLLVKNK